LLSTFALYLRIGLYYKLVTVGLNPLMHMLISCYFCLIFESGTDRLMATYLAVVVLVYTTFSKKPKDPSFQIGSGWNLTPLLFIDLRDGSFDMTSYFQNGGHVVISRSTVLHMVTAYATSVRRICSSVRQFPIRGTFVRFQVVRICQTWWAICLSGYLSRDFHFLPRDAL